MGGSGQDFLFGGTGNDTFVDTRASDAGGPGMFDVIGDFQSGADLIDVHAVIAGGHFIGVDGFMAREGATLRYTQATGMLQGDLNGDGMADFQINLSNHTVLVDSDFTF